MHTRSQKAELFRVGVISLTLDYSYLKLRASVRGAADSMHTVVVLRSLCQCGIFLGDFHALPQSHITHKQQSRAVCLTGLGILQTGAEDDKEYSLKMAVNNCRLNKAVKCCLS